MALHMGKSLECAAICSTPGSSPFHSVSLRLPGRIATPGNLVFPFSPSDVKVGEVFVFSVYGLLMGEDPLNLFPIIYEEIGGGAQ